MLFGDITSRARAFGVISGMGGVGAAAGPLIGGFITWAVSWRAAFVFQALIVALIVLLGRRMEDPVAPDQTSVFDTVGAILSAVGLVLVVLGIMQADNNAALMALLSRSVSNLGSSLGTAVAGTILVAGLTTPNRSYALAGVGVLLAMAKGSAPGPSLWLLIGLGIGVMLMPSVNIVQSAFAEELQGEISGLAMVALAVIGALGLVAALFLPAAPAVGTAPPSRVRTNPAT